MRVQFIEMKKLKEKTRFRIQYTQHNIDVQIMYVGYTNMSIHYIVYTHQIMNTILFFKYIPKYKTQFIKLNINVCSKTWVYMYISIIYYTILFLV